MQEPAPVSDAIIDRVALLWSRALVAPKFDNGPDSAASALAGVLAAETARLVMGADDYAARLSAFRMALAAGMKFERDHEGEPRPDARFPNETYRLSPSIGVDYGPDLTLARAAEIADLPADVFPWKSSIALWGRDYITTSFGYRGAEEYHYPLSGGRWLITSLRLDGKDRAAIIAAVEAGRLPELTVEEAAS